MGDGETPKDQQGDTPPTPKAPDPAVIHKYTEADKKNRGKSQADSKDND